MTQTLLLDKYPMASGYIMGVYNTSTDFLDCLLKDKNSVKFMKQLDDNIFSYHPKWNRDEIYWRGVDLSEAFIDICASVDIGHGELDEYEKLKIMHALVRLSKHHHSVVLLAHAIGTLYNETEH